MKIIDLKFNYYKTIIYFLFITILFNSCIEEYTPIINTQDSRKYVVSGLLTNKEGNCEITINLVSSINNPHIIPLDNCDVKITNSNGNSCSFTESKIGIYKSWIPQSFLNIGNIYKLEIITPDGTKIVSDNEEMVECPDIDSVYFERKDLPTNNPEEFTKGIQFYIDLNAPNINTKFFKFDIEETWEYHSIYPLEWYYDGIVHHVDPPDYSRNVCWRTNEIKNIFILNTSDLDVNVYKNFPLHFVDNRTSRLAYMYSILIKQYSLTEKCFTFWDQLRSNNFNDASLYETQPLPVQGNLHNITNPNISVLGYFQVSAVKTKRIFIKDVENLELDYSDGCSTFNRRYGLIEITPDEYPAYNLDEGGFIGMNRDCVDCTLLGGTTVKPDFWPGN